MKAATLSALALLLAAGGLRADPPGVVGRIEKGGGEVSRDGPGGRVDMVLLTPSATDADLAGLCELRAMHSLWLTDARVSADGLRAVAGLPRLRNLYLQGDNVTDAGLRHLEAMQGLRVLRVDGCPNVTEAGVERLKKALPGCKVYR